jgi:hypothetical protein
VASEKSDEALKRSSRNAAGLKARTSQSAALEIVHLPISLCRTPPSSISPAILFPSNSSSIPSSVPGCDIILFFPRLRRSSWFLTDLFLAHPIAPAKRSPLRNLVGVHHGPPPSIQGGSGLNLLHPQDASESAFQRHWTSLPPAQRDTVVLSNLCLLTRKKREVKLGNEN